jgi:hypothetical protein
MTTAETTQEPAAADAALAPRSYKVGIKTKEDNKDWICNRMRYSTPEKAEAAGSDLSYRWTAVTEHKVLPSDDEPNA